MPATTVGQDGLEVDEVERPVADVVPLAQLQEDGVGSLSTELTLTSFQSWALPKQRQLHAGNKSSRTFLSSFQS